MQLRHTGWMLVVVGMVMWSVSYGQERRPERAGQTERAGQAQETASTGQFHKASTLIGMQVKGENDAELGEVQDLLIDAETSTVKFVIVSSGGLLTSESRAIPCILAETQTAADSEERYVSLPLSKERFTSAPKINVAEAKLMANAEWVTDANQFFATEIQQRRVARPELNEDEPTRERPNRQRNPQRQPQPRTPNQPNPDRP